MIRWDSVKVGDVLEWGGDWSETYVVLEVRGSGEGRVVKLLSLWDGVVVDGYPAPSGTLERYPRWLA